MWRPVVTGPIGRILVHRHHILSLQAQGKWWRRPRFVLCTLSAPSAAHFRIRMTRACVCAWSSSPLCKLILQIDKECSLKVCQYGKGHPYLRDCGAALVLVDRYGLNAADHDPRDANASADDFVCLRVVRWSCRDIRKQSRTGKRRGLECGK